MRYLLIIPAILLTSCTINNRELHVYAEDGALLSIRDVEILADVKKGDENQTTRPDISPDINLPLGGL